MNDQPVRSFYRVSRTPIPEDISYLTRRDKFPERPAGISDMEWHAWSGLSFYNSEESARRCGQNNTHLGNRIVRYDILEGAGIVWDEPDDEGHQNVWGDKEAIKHYLIKGWEAPVKQKARQETKGQP